MKYKEKSLEHKREYLVNRNYQTRFVSILEKLGFDHLGIPISNKWDKFIDKDGACNTPIFKVFPYYWGDEDILKNKPNFEFKPLRLEIDWYKYPFRNSHSNIVVTGEILKTIEECCLNHKSTLLKER